jgi:hypothetical protein
MTAPRPKREEKPRLHRQSLSVNPRASRDRACQEYILSWPPNPHCDTDERQPARLGVHIAGIPTFYRCFGVEPAAWAGESRGSIAGEERSRGSGSSFYSALVSNPAAIRLAKLCFQVSHACGQRLNLVKT